jgi:hypothetical protein
VADDDDHGLGALEERPVRAGITRRGVVEALAAWKRLVAGAPLLPRPVLAECAPFQLADADVVELGDDDVRDITSVERDRRGLLGSGETRGDDKIDLERRDLMAEQPSFLLALRAQPGVDSRICVHDTRHVEPRLSMPGEQEGPHEARR